MIKFSIIIALAPERKILVLDSIKKLDYPKNEYEVIIKVSKSASKNRNDGTKEAKGGILVFIDDDCEVPESLLKKAEKIFKDYPEISALGGPQLTPLNDSFFGKSVGLVIQTFLSSAFMYKRYKKSKFSLNANESELTTANFFIKKDVFKKLGGFDENIWPGEDTKLFLQLIQNNYKIAYSPDIYIYHKRRQNFKELSKQHYNYGYVMRYLNPRLKFNFKTLIFLSPSLWLIYTILSPLLYYFNKILILPLLFYLALVILNSLYLTLKKPLALPLFPPIFIIIHYAYGLGFLIGKIKKVK